MARKAATMDFEERLKQLQEIVIELESGNPSLERGVALYKEGVSLARDCRERLQNARNEIRVFSRGAFEPFEESGDGGNAAGPSELAEEDAAAGPDNKRDE